MTPSTVTRSAGAAGALPTIAAVHADPAAMGGPGYPLNVKEIQGNILGGFDKDYQSFLFLRFTHKKPARDWVGSIAAEVASVEEVASFNTLFKIINSRRGGELGVLKATWMNIAFTHKGIAFLGASEANAFPIEFKEGMKARAAANHDTGASAPANWVEALRDGDIHAMMIVAADSQKDLGENVLRYIHNMGIHGVQVVYLQEGIVRVDEPGHEHFGFRDGVSQPGVRHFDGHIPSLTSEQAKPIHGNPGQDRLHAGEFILGYPTQLLVNKDCGGGKSSKPNPDEGPISPLHATGAAAGNETAPAWGKNGSYLVFRRLAQNVSGFHAMVQELAKQGKLGTNDPAVVGAKLVGRYKSGAPLERTLDEKALFPAPPFETTHGDPSQAVANKLGVNAQTKTPEGDLAEDRRLNNHFEYSDDLGAIVPRASHIRKVYPRDEIRPDGNENDSQIHRILRRGIPFGVSFKPGITGATGHGGKPGIEEPGDRGLLFLCYQSSLKRQFEFIQQKWVHNKDFPTTGDGQDPIIAQTADGKFALQDGAGMNKAHVEIMQFVKMTGGEYFFQPSICALTTELGNPIPKTNSLPFPAEPKPWDIDALGADPCAGAD